MPLFFPSSNITSDTSHPNLSNDSFTRCLIQAEKVFNSLSLQWFIAFGSALMYHRSKNFVSNDIDIGIIFDEMVMKSIAAKELILHFNRFGFRLLARYGKLADGQGWTFRCPKSKLHFGIFVFYRIDFETKSNRSYAWWTASYNGLCKKMPFRKCRRGFTELNLEQFQMNGKSFNVVSKQFLIDQYGPHWIIPRNYTYAQSIKRMTNLIDLVV